MSSKRKILLDDYRKVLRDFFAREGVKPFPRRWKYRLLILYSAVRALEVGLPYTEDEINDAIVQWQKSRGSFIDLDHVTLRRYLVDLGFLDRNPSGSVYAVIHSFLEEADWDPLILEADEDALLAQARRDVDSGRLREPLLDSDVDLLEG
jgi:hypothetical protein